MERIVRLRACMSMLAAMAVFIAAVLPFAHSMRYDLLDYDDQLYVIENAHMREGLTCTNAIWAFRSCGYAFNWHPLTWLSLMADVTLCGGEPDDAKWASRENRIGHFMHAHNVVLHGVNCVLLFFLLMAFRRRFAAVDTDEASELPSILFCAVCALAWALHPLRTEVVCWVAERKELLSVGWMLASLLFYEGLVGKELRGARAWFRYGSAGMCFALALLAKPVAVTLPALLFALDWVYGGKMKIVRLIPFVALSAAVCVLTLFAQTETMGTGATMSWVQRMQASVGGPVVYLAQTMWPRGLSAFYRLHRELDWKWLVPGVSLLLTMAGIVCAWLKSRRPALGDCTVVIVWAYVGLMPMLGIVKAGTEEHSDRYTYWVGCGLAAALVLAWPRVKALARRIDLRLETMRACQVLGVVVCVLGVASYLRSAVWHDTTTLFRDALPKCWQSGVAIGIANTLQKQGGSARAEGEAILRRTMAENPNADICGGLAFYLASGHIHATVGGFSDTDPFGEVRYLAMRALSADAGNLLAYEALALADARSGKWADALKNYIRAQEINPQKDYAPMLEECSRNMTREKE